MNVQILQGSVVTDLWQGSTLFQVLPQFISEFNTERSVKIDPQ